MVYRCRDEGLGNDRIVSSRVDMVMDWRSNSRERDTDNGTAEDE